MTELLLVHEGEEGNGKELEGSYCGAVKPLEKGVFYAMEVVAFMAVVSAFAVVIWQMNQGVGLGSGSDGRWCQLMNE